ncbi:DUF937 domain-containing protein [Sphingobium aromaticiconvertens]|uniref:DUF937 domain-containing protein n=1 Tax=Sphingobium aromaticiconvertens TaxID=365341 RepID=UPI003016F1A3
MDIGEMLKQTGALDSMSRELGIDATSAQAGAAALLPAILGGFKKQAQPDTGGMGGLMDVLGQLGGGGLLESLTSSNPTPTQPGNDVLGQIFGSKDVSRQVADHAAQTSGVEPSILRKMLPMLAMAVAGYMFSNRGAAAGEPAGGGLLGGLLGKILGGGNAAAPAQGGLGQGGLGSLIDLNGNGNPLDDILGMATKFRN